MNRATALLLSGLALLLAPNVRSAGPDPRPAEPERRGPATRPATRPAGGRGEIPLPLQLIQFKLLKVEERSITVKPNNGPDQGRELTFVIDRERTKVFVGVPSGEVKAPDGRTAPRRVTTRRGAFADLAPGQGVMLHAQPNAATIETVTITPAPWGEEREQRKRGGAKPGEPKPAGEGPGEKK